jgi:hypothetical protein
MTLLRIVAMAASGSALLLCGELSWEALQRGEFWMAAPWIILFGLAGVLWKSVIWPRR